MSILVPQGTTLGLTGPNGAGKTTLLKILATIHGSSAGEGEVLGYPLRSGGAEIRQRTAFLSVRGYLYDELTAAENLAFTLRMCGLAVSTTTLDEALDLVGLAALADDRVRTFSTGMRKRLALAQLWIRPVRLALLDEPYAGLDEEGTAIVDTLVRELRADGVTVVIASHLTGEALRSAEQTAIIRDGDLKLAEPAARGVS